MLLCAPAVILHLAARDSRHQSLAGYLETDGRLRSRLRVISAPDHSLALGWQCTYVGIVCSLYLLEGKLAKNLLKV